MATPSPLRTVRDLLRLAVSRFTAARLSFGHGSANAYERSRLPGAAYAQPAARHARSVSRCAPAAEEIDAVMHVIDRRVNERVPAAYITHEAYMHGLRFYVDSRVIVPRSFIGELLQDGLEPWIGETTQVGPVLELCTGSGCLPIIAAHVWPNAQVDAVDISPDALAVARRNVADYKMQERIHLFEGDLYAPLPPGATYDVILTNPPYVNETSMQALPPEYQAEPRIALAGGDDGMDVVRRIIAGAKARLNPGGVLVVEIGNEHANVEAAFPNLEIVWLPVSAGDDQVFLLTYDALPG
ncbi:50S ribosomal protein L3 N(5)-glutamine methyltransferase [Cupriavidus basilensis]